MTRFFSPEGDPSLFTCSGHPDGSCGAAQPTPRLLAMLEAARAAYGRPIVVTSGVRCAAHNAAVGGVEDSEHVSGEAADLACRTSVERWRLVESLRLAGFRRIVLYRAHVHVDVSATKVQDVLGVSA